MKNLCYGEYLRVLRKSRNLTIMQLAKDIGISSQYLSEMERGGRKCLNEEKTNALRKALSITEEENVMLKKLADKVSKRVIIPADIKAYIEENPYIIEEIHLAMERGLRVRVSA
ncbi:helix-turn-helix domain-containing protein [Butyrivibrio hungatei]|uniref:HTH domain-containing protein n=1 Tax=Butyrivibrio hungatei TaxID=185008 RepID=A0A1D9P5Q4_9FIRM|nr:helix-turn-helix transcriptional regulator [Butyrivibrio hungatei]AOZ97900.1 HTH domain-containing protein [Butyrivibrio hungatei]